VHAIDVGQASATLVEFQSGVFLVDAGSESDDDGQHLVQYLDEFFSAHNDLKRTLQSIIITHPHIDHTRSLNDVLENFTVKALIDGGADHGSGIVPLKAARAYAKENKIEYLAISDGSVHETGLTNQWIDPFTKPAGPDISLLTGARGCKNQNNDSLIVLIRYQAKGVLITGDAENTNDAECGASEIGLLLDRYSNHPELLDVDLYIVGHHGSYNGTTSELLKRLTPQVAVMSAGKKQPQTRFSAYGYGHPRQVTVERLEEDVSGSRVKRNVYVMPAPHIYRDWVAMKAIYCTCWEGDVVIQLDQTGFHTLMPQ